MVTNKHILVNLLVLSHTNSEGLLKTCWSSQLALLCASSLEVRQARERRDSAGGQAGLGGEGSSGKIVHSDRPRVGGGRLALAGQAKWEGTPLEKIAARGGLCCGLKSTLHCFFVYLCTGNWNEYKETTGH